MLPIAGNYSNDRRFKKTNWMCWCGHKREEEIHIREHCPIYKDIRKKFDSLDNDENLVAFFKEVLQRRDKME